MALVVRQEQEQQDLPGRQDLLALVRLVLQDHQALVELEQLVPQDQAVLREQELRAHLDPQDLRALLGLPALRVRRGHQVHQDYLGRQGHLVPAGLELQAQRVLVDHQVHQDRAAQQGLLAPLDPLGHQDLLVQLVPQVLQELEQRVQLGHQAPVVQVEQEQRVQQVLVDQAGPLVLLDLLVHLEQAPLTSQGQVQQMAPALTQSPSTHLSLVLVTRYSAHLIDREMIR